MINHFSAQYAFLSNFAPSSINIKGEVYATTEHLYQLSKTLNEQQREEIRLATQEALQLERLI